MMTKCWTVSERALVNKHAHKPLGEIRKKLQIAGYDRPEEAIARFIRRERIIRSLGKKLRVGYLDIESTGLNATFGRLLSWCIKEGGKDKIYYDVAKRNDIINFRSDEKIVRSLVDALKNFDHIVTYYGGMKNKRFDLRMIFSRSLKHGIPFPHYGQLTQTDLYDVVKQRLNLHSSRLATVCEFLGIVGKTPLDTKAWELGALGHGPSLKKILEHNIGDVEILEKVDRRLAKFHANRRNIF